MGKEFTEQEKAPSKRRRKSDSSFEEEGAEEVRPKKLRTRNKRVVYCEKEIPDIIDEPIVVPQPKPEALTGLPVKEKKKRGRKPKNRPPVDAPAVQSSVLKPDLSSHEQGPSSYGDLANDTSPYKDPTDRSSEMERLPAASEQKLSARPAKNTPTVSIDRFEQPFIANTNVDTGDGLQYTLHEDGDIIEQYFTL